MEGQVVYNTENIVGSSISGNNLATQTQAQTPPGSTLMYGTPSRTVRTNWIHYLRASWRQISRTSKFILGTTLLLGLVQIIITIAVLIIGKNEACDKPLNVYLIVFLVRLGFSLPLTLYQYLRPSGLDGRNNLSISTTTSSSPTSMTNSSDITPTNHHGSSIITLPSSSTSLTPDGPEDTHSANSPTVASNISLSSSNRENNNALSNIQHRPYQPTRIRSSWLDRFKSLLDLISILWFVVGNYMIFTASEQCHREAKYLFYTTMAWILLGYFFVLIPLLLCVAVVFCLPCLLVAMRVFNVDYATGMVGANKNEIQAIPVYKYKSSSANHHVSSLLPTSASYQPTSSSRSPSLSTCSSVEKKKHGIMAHFISYHNKHNDHHESGLEEWTMDPTDASCTICLSDYENGELVCRLWCSHHFHKDCVHEWLSLNYKCPLCQRDFRRDKANGGDDGSGT